MNAVAPATTSAVSMLAALGEPVMPTSPGLGSDLLIQTGAGLLVFIALLVWAKFLRRKKRKRKRHHRSEPLPSHRTTESIPAADRPSPPPSGVLSPGSPASPADGEAPRQGEGEEDRPHHHRRRRQRREHRPRNPTLAETGGLPPRRETGHSPSAL